MTRQKLLQLGWEVLIHPPYSPDIAPSDFHLFRCLPNSLNEKISIPWKIVKGTWNKFFGQKDKKFWEGGITKLPEKWQKVVEKGESLFNKVLGENEKCVFYFYLKTEDTGLSWWLSG